MKLTGLHLLLTYQCTLECDHCFVWGSAHQEGTMTLRDVRHVLAQARDVGTVESIYFEGGEPFLYYPVLVKGVQEAVALGFRVGLVTNSYWATSVEDALEWLRPLAGLVEDLSISSDLYHSDEKLSRQAKAASQAAAELGISAGVITVAGPEDLDVAHVTGQLPPGESGVMFRGRAAATLAARAPGRPWQELTSCPYENLRDPGRVHVDPLGYLHLCHGLVMGNLQESSLAEVCAAFEPDNHPIVGPLLEGGPAELVRCYGLRPADTYADACHLCYQARRALRPYFPGILAPDQMYGEVG